MRRLLRYLWPYRLSVVVALTSIICASVLQLAQPYLMKLAIDRHIARADLAGLDRIALAFLAILLASFALEYLQTWVLQMTGQRIMFDMRMQIYEHLQRIDLQFYDRNPVGRLMTRVTTDVDVLNDLFTAGVVSIFGDVFTLLGIMIVLVMMDWRLALLAFSVLPLIVLVTQWFRKHVRESYRTVRIWIARINAFLQEHITGMTTVQLFRRERRSYERFDAINRQHRDANVESIFYYAVFYPAIEIIGALAAALLIWFGGGWTIQGTLTLGSLVAFLLYSQRFFRPISDMSEKFNVLQAAMASSERIFKLLDTPVAIESPLAARNSLLERPSPRLGDEQRAASKRAAKERGHILFDHVWFAYNGTDYVLKDVSFEVRPGQRVGVVGATGAGKSSLINLLLRFYDVTQGRILVDGVDVREVPLPELRAAVQPRAAGRSSLLGDHRRERPLGQHRYLGRCHPAGGGDGSCRSIHRPVAAGLSESGSRAWRDAIGRPEAALVLRSSAGLRSGGARPRRSDLERRHRDRNPDPRRPPRPDGGAHDDRHRPPPVDHPGHGQDPGTPSRRAPRVGLAPGAARQARALFQAVSAAIQGSGNAGGGANGGYGREFHRARMTRG